MKYLTIAILLFIACFLGAGMQTASAQNRKQTKKRTAKMKKLGKYKIDGVNHTPSWYSLDKDGDGVPQNRDKCPHTVSGIKVTPFGCPVEEYGSKSKPAQAIVQVSPEFIKEEE